MFAKSSQGLGQTYQSSFDKAVRANMGAESSLQSLGSKAKSVLGGAVPIGAAAAGAAVAVFAKQSLDAAIGFDKSMTQIAALTNTPSEAIQGMRDNVLDLAGETAQAPQDLAEAMYFLSSAGLDATQQTETLTAAAKAQAVGLGQAGDIARITANALNVYGDSGLKAADVTDTLAAAVREGSAEPDEFADALGRVLPIADQAGIGFDQVAASLATMSNAGLDVNEGVTALRGVLQSLVAPTKQTQDALGKIGLTVDDVVQSMQQQGLISTLRMLDERTRRNTDSQGEYNVLMRQIIPNVRAFTGALNLTGQEADKVDSIFHAVADSTGSLDRAFDITQQSASFRFTKAMNDIKLAGTEIAGAVLPLLASTVSNIAGPFTSAAEAVSSLSRSLSGLTDAVDGATGGGGAFMNLNESISETMDIARDLFTFNFSDAVDKAGNIWERFTDVLHGGTGATEEQSQALQANSEFAQVAADTAEKYAAKQREANAAAMAGGPSLAELTSKLGALDAIGIDTTKFLDDLKTKLEDSEDPAKDIGAAFVDLTGQIQDWHDETADNLTNVGGVLGALADDAHLTTGEISDAFQDAAKEARAFTSDLVTIAHTGGQTGKDLSAALLALGPDMAGVADKIASSSGETRNKLISDFGDITAAGDTGADKLQNALVPVLDDIRGLLVKIARKWGVTVRVDASGAIQEIERVQVGLTNMTRKTYDAFVRVHTEPRSPWPDEAMEMHLFEPMRRNGFRKDAKGWNLPVQIGVHSDVTGPAFPHTREAAADIVRMISRSGATPKEGLGVVQRVARRGLQPHFIEQSVADVMRELGKDAARKYEKELTRLDQWTKTGDAQRQAAIRSAQHMLDELTKKDHSPGGGMRPSDDSCAWLDHALRHAPKLPEGHTRIDPNRHQRDLRVRVNLDRKRFDQEQAYETTFGRGF